MSSAFVLFLRITLTHTMQYWLNMSFLILINCVFWVKREENGDIAIRDGRGGYEQVARDHSRRQDNLSSRSR